MFSGAYKRISDDDLEQVLRGSVLQQAGTDIALWEAPNESILMLQIIVLPKAIRESLPGKGDLVFMADAWVLSGIPDWAIHYPAMGDIAIAWVFGPDKMVYYRRGDVYVQIMKIGDSLAPIQFPVGVAGEGIDALLLDQGY